MPIQAPKWWGAPANFDDRKYERKVSWLELFYDLVYVAAMGQLTHHIAAHPGWQSLAFSFLLFSMLFWSWVNGSQYHDLHGSEGIRTRLLTFYQMLAVAAVAITLDDAFEEGHRAFAIAFACLQGLITWLWFSIGFYDPGHRRFSNYYTFFYLLALALLVLSAFTSSYLATWLWIAAIILNVAPPFALLPTMFRLRRNMVQEFSLSATLLERFGLFTIIVLAESILATVTGIAEVKDKLPSAWFAFILAIMISFLLWSIYFDMINNREAKHGYLNMQWFIFVHFPLLSALGVVGACMHYMLLHMKDGLGTNMQWMFCVAIAIILLTTVLLSSLIKEEEPDKQYMRSMRRILEGLIIIILLIPLSGIFHQVLPFLLLISILLLAPMIYGIVLWARNRDETAHADESRGL